MGGAPPLLSLPDLGVGSGPLIKLVVGVEPNDVEHVLDQEAVDVPPVGC